MLTANILYVRLILNWTDANAWPAGIFYEVKLFIASKILDLFVSSFRFLFVCFANKNTRSWQTHRAFSAEGAVRVLLYIGTKR